LTNYVRKFDNVHFIIDHVGMGVERATLTDHHTYAESLFCLRCADQLSASDKEWMLGKTAREVLAWPGPA
jgi:hypothetical protein